MLIVKYVIVGILSFVLGSWLCAGYCAWRGGPMIWKAMGPSWGCGAFLFIIGLHFLGRHLGQLGSPQIVVIVQLACLLAGFLTYAVGIRGSIKAQRNFELTLPPGWHERPYFSSNPEFYGPDGSAIKFAIGPIYPEPTVEEQKENLVRIALKHGHTVIATGEIEVAGKRHATMICEVPFIGLLKNYSLIFDGIEYLVTVRGNFDTCDAIVKSFKLTRRS